MYVTPLLLQIPNYCWSKIKIPRDDYNAIFYGNILDYVQDI